MSGKMLTSSDCSNMIQQFLNMLEGWKWRVVSIMDRVTLVRLVLSIVSIYLLSHAIILREVLLNLENII